MLKLDKRQHEHVQELRASGATLEGARDILEFLLGLIEEEELKTKTYAQHLRLGDLCRVIENAIKGVNNSIGNDKN